MFQPHFLLDPNGILHHPVLLVVALKRASHVSPQLPTGLDMDLPPLMLHSIFISTSKPHSLHPEDGDSMVLQNDGILPITTWHNSKDHDLNFYRHKNFKFHTLIVKPECSVPLPKNSTTRLFTSQVSNVRHCEIHNKPFCYSEGLSVLCPISKLEDHAMQTS
jgi:hypothetical protein